MHADTDPTPPIPGLDWRRLGDAIARRRSDLGMTLYALAKAAGIHASYLKKIETGQATGLGLGILGQIAGSLKTSAATLIREAGAGPYESTLADRIAARADDLHLSRQQLAERAGISEVTLYLVEVGSTTALTPDEYDRLATALAVEAAWLREGEAPPMDFSSLADVRAWLHSHHGVEDIEILDHLEHQMRVLIRLDRQARGLPPLREVE